MTVAERLSDRKRMLIFVNVLISCMAASLLQTALNTALATISSDLHVDVTAGQWMTSCYSLSMGIIMPLTAFLIRRVKTKRLYITGLMLFIIGLVVDIFAFNFPMLIIGRVFQGCGNGILISMTQVVILSIFTKDKQGTAMGWYGLAVSVMPAIAPTVGGILVETVSWRAIFILALAILVVALIMGLRVFENVLDNEECKLDTLSFILSVLAFGGLTLGVGNLATYGILNPFVYIPLIVGVVTFIIFVRRQLKGEEPFLDFHILRNQAVTVGVASSMILYFVLMGSSVLMPLYVQNVKGGTAVLAGLVTLPGSVLMAVVSPLSGRLYDRLGIKRLFMMGSAFLALSSLLMFFLREPQPLGFPIAYSLLRYLAIGLIMMPLITYGTTHAGPKKMADASAMLSSLRTIGGAMGTAVFVGISSAVAARVAGNSDPNPTQLMHVMNIAFLIMAFTSVVLLLISIFCVKGKKKEEQELKEVAETTEGREEEEVVETVEESEPMKAMEAADAVPTPEAVEVLEEEAEEEVEEEEQKTEE